MNQRRAQYTYLNLCLVSLHLPSSSRFGDLSPNNLLPGASLGRPTVNQTTTQDVEYYTILTAWICLNLYLVSLRLHSSSRSGDLSPNNLLPRASLGNFAGKNMDSWRPPWDYRGDHWTSLKDFSIKINLLGEFDDLYETTSSPRRSPDPIGSRSAMVISGSNWKLCSIKDRILTAPTRKAVASRHWNSSATTTQDGAEACMTCHLKGVFATRTRGCQDAFILCWCMWYNACTCSSVCLGIIDIYGN